MRRYVRIKKPDTIPQSGLIWTDKGPFSPIFWHTAINQNRPVGSKSTFSEHAHDFYHISLYTKGTGYYSKEGRFEQSVPGRCVLIHPGQRHDFVSRMGTAVYSEITFTYENKEGQPCMLSFDQILSGIAGAESSLKEKITLQKASRNTLHNYLVQITDYLNSTHPQSLYYAHWTLEHIFSFLIEHCCRQNSPEILDDRFIRIQMWIEQHYTDTLSIDELAHMAGMSKGYFFRAFKKATGIAPLTYQQKLRIEAAKTLLKTTSLRCNEIAYRVGFNDVCFFHRLFKKHAKRTPSQYRKQGNSRSHRSQVATL